MLAGRFIKAYLLKREFERISAVLFIKKTPDILEFFEVRILNTIYNF